MKKTLAAGGLGAVILAALGATLLLVVVLPAVVLTMSSPAVCAAGVALAPADASGLTAALGAIAIHESGGNPRARNPFSDASGKYQFIGTTWRRVAVAAGFPQWADGPAADAPEDVQDAVALHYAKSVLPELGGNLVKLADVWYVGRVIPEGDPALDRVPAGGNTITPRQYEAEIANLMGGTTAAIGTPPVACPSATLTAAGAVAPTAVQTAIGFALAQVGKPYRWGGTGPDGFDCSGLAMMAYRAGGVDLPRTTYQQVNVGSAVAEAALAPGDLLFPDADHVQLYLGNGLVVEAPHTGANVRVTKMWGFWQARRVVAWSPAAGTPALLVATGSSVGGRLVFDDEFAGNALDSSKWTPLRGCGTYDTPYNPWEGVTFSPANVAVGGGVLALSFHHGNPDGAYAGTGANVETDCHEAFTYGYFEALIWVPPVYGTWPAFWLTAVDGWPPETDIFEFGQHGLDPQVPTVTFHWPGNPGGQQTAYADGVAGSWHRYGLLWDANHEQVFLDGQPGPALTGDGVPHQPMQIVLSLTTYGNGYDAGIPEGTAMLVKYVRVWQ